MNRPVNFRIFNNIVGWLAFGISLSVYLLTLEPTGSFWDCGEFASCASKLEIPHAPGAPLFTLIYRVAAMLYPSNPGIMCNAASALASAFTILFLFWTISWFGRKLFFKTWQENNLHKIVILFASFIGSMSYAVSDSFWFSAVESEVYALSSLFTAVVFWCILRWEESFGKNLNSERWLLLIAYLFGLSVGVHLLNLLAIPAIVMIYYLKIRPFNKATILKALGTSVIILIFFLVLFIPGIPWFFSKMEILTVNTFNMPFNSGMFLALILIWGILIIGWVYCNKKGKKFAARFILYFAVIFVGFSTYGFILIRSADNPPIDMNNPEDPFSLTYYLNREQYGKRPLLYGQSFASPVISTEDRYTYIRYNGRYIKSPLNARVNYDKSTLMLFPRLSSDEPGHVEAYQSWTGGFHGKKIRKQNGTGYITSPSFGDNIRFFIRYQLGFMYFRYFMWNFAGRQNDILGHGNVIHGNWLTGISFIDNARLGSGDKLPKRLSNNAARNRYYMLPLFLGLAGMYFQYRNDKRNFRITMLFFLFTGIAIVVYLNEVPVIPRERDYVSVGSFYVFSIWIGLGVLALFRLAEKIKGIIPAISAVIPITLTVPILMLQQNWDDHNRSGRYTLLEYAGNYLKSCEPNAILFTNADNDTYPLWYAQEVEGIRRDVRIVLLPYLSAEWYVDQLRASINHSDGIKMDLGQDKYIAGKRTYLPVFERTDTAVDLKELMEFVASDDPRTKLDLNNGGKINYIPSRKLILKSNTGNIKDTASGDVEIALKSDYIRMDQLVLLDILQSNFGKRPIYFTTPQEPLNYGLQNYLELDGIALKLTSHKNLTKAGEEAYNVNAEKLYYKLMEQFSYASLENGNIYFDYMHYYIFSMISLRSKFALLAEQLIKEEKNAQAEKVLKRITSLLPGSRIPYDKSMIKIAGLFIKIGQISEGQKLLKEITGSCKENLAYFNSLPHKYLSGISQDIQMNLYLLSEVNEFAQTINWNALSDECRDIWNREGERLMGELE